MVMVRGGPEVEVYAADERRGFTGRPERTATCFMRTSVPLGASEPGLAGGSTAVPLVAGAPGLAGESGAR